MPRNVYFSQKVRSEQNLYEDLIVESLTIYGQDVYYLPRNIITRDNILGEDVESQFDDAYMVEMYIENTEGFEGEGNLFSKFGLEIRDEATFVVARKTWNKLVGFNNNTVNNMRPNEGDLIYLPLSNSFFEISFVEHEQPFYQISNLPVYKLQCRLFEYNEEDFDTNILEVDQIAAAHADSISMLIGDYTITDWTIGERLYQVLEYDSSGNATKIISGEIIDLEEVAGIPITTNVTMYLGDIEISGGTTNSQFKVSTASTTSTYLMADPAAAPAARTRTARIIEIYDYDDSFDGTFANDPSAMNKEFETEAAGFIDFSEANPFGEIDNVAINTPTTLSSFDTSMSSTSRTFDSNQITMDKGNI